MVVERARQGGRGAVSRTLVEVARGTTPTTREEPARAAELVTALRYHRIGPLGHVRLRDTHPGVSEHLRPDRDAAIAFHVRATIMLDALRGILDGIPWVTFKGPVLSETAHPVPGLRSYRDVDVLVDPSSLRDVTRRLQEAAWVVADYEDMLHNPQTPGEMHWVSPAGILVDLHWSMINMATRRRRFAVGSAALLERRIPVRLGLGEAWTLDPVDALVHVCLHAALTGANKVVYLLDADHLAGRTPDWDEVGQRARAWGAQTHVAVVLGRARAVLGTTLPTGLHRTLGVSTGLWTLSGTVDRLSPVPTLRREASAARLFARAVQPDVTHTLAAVARNVGLGVRHRLQPGQLVAPVRERADADALQAYLAAVEAAART